MVACRYRWLAAFLPFIDIKKAKSIISDFMPTDFPNEKNKHTMYNLPSPSNQPAGTFIFKLYGIIRTSTRDFLVKLVRH